MGFVKWSLFLLPVQNLYSSNREDTGRSPAPVVELFNDVNSFDKSLMEQMAMVEQLDKKEKTAFYAVLDAFLGKKKMKDALSNILTNV